MNYSRFWDISMPLAQGMPVWPGDTPFERTVRQTGKGDQTWSNSEIRMSCHCGTHMDAPRHVFEQGGDINSIPLAVLIGECRVVEVASSVIGPDQLEHVRPKRGERIIFKTRNSIGGLSGKFNKDYISFNGDCARALVEAQVVLVGVDGPSVDPFNAVPAHAHTAFCEAGVAVLENLLLGEVEPGEYTLICLPLKLDGSDGSPVRAILAR